jgi:predicted CXXCH cytochrome family protein
MFLLGVATLVGGGKARASPAPYDDRVCATCHSELTKQAHVHTAVASGSCSDCHAPSDSPGKCKAPVGKGWKLSATDPELCAGCHDVKGKSPSVHPALDLGCTSCHDPHGSPNPSQLKQWPIAQLCAGCHDRKDTKKAVHTAVRNGQCLGCHDPHAGEAAPLLKKQRTELCSSCHAPAQIAKGEAVHGAVTRGLCLGCHDPHGSDNPKQLRRIGNALCLECHDAKSTGKPDRAAIGIDLGKKDVHPALDAAECTGCHAPHSSAWAKELQKPLPVLCYDCHDRQDREKHVHGAVTLGRCNVCHDPHSSSNGKLLRDAKPADLCFRCHSDDLAGRKHVHTPVAMGECLLCHQPHGSGNAKSLQKPVPALCVECHNGIADKKNVHAAVTRFGCTGCHDPHGAATEFQLLAADNDLCLKCHPKITGDHVFIGFDGRTHPLSGKPDPSRPGKTLGCLSCHSPHSSDNPKLFLKGTAKMEVCNNCHAKH